MNLLDPVSKIMTPNPICVNSKEPLSEIEKIFSTHRIHHLPVVDDGKLVGIVSKSDFLFFRKGFSNDENEKLKDKIRLNNYTTGDIMTTGLAKMEPEEKINVALEVFKENIFHAIPIVEGDKIVGILTTYDIIKELAVNEGAKMEY